MQRQRHVLPKTPVESADTPPGTEVQPAAADSSLDGGIQQDVDRYVDVRDGDPGYGIAIGALVGAACWLSLWLLYVALA